jgi:hypothetical protein
MWIERNAPGYERLVRSAEKLRIRISFSSVCVLDADIALYLRPEYYAAVGQDSHRDTQDRLVAFTCDLK